MGRRARRSWPSTTIQPTWNRVSKIHVCNSFPIALQVCHGAASRLQRLVPINVVAQRPACALVRPQWPRHRDRWRCWQVGVIHVMSDGGDGKAVGSWVAGIVLPVPIKIKLAVLGVGSKVTTRIQGLLATSHRLIPVNRVPREDKAWRTDCPFVSARMVLDVALSMRHLWRWRRRRRKERGHRRRRRRRRRAGR